MLTGFFLAGRSASGSADAVPRTTMARRLSLGFRSRPDDAVPGDGGPVPHLPPIDRAAPDLTPGSRAAQPTPAALSAASEAERVRRLRASFEEDLAHFLRSGTTAASD